MKLNLGQGVTASAVMLAMAFATAQPMNAQDPSAMGNLVRDTPHNLSGTAGSVSGIMDALIAQYDVVCGYCHYPHGSAPGAAPLWNKALAATGTYTMYTSATSSTLDMTVGADPGGVSLACLSCHDGTVALDAVLQVPLGASETTSDGGVIGGCAISGCHSGASPSAGLDFAGGEIGVDLENDHPIAVTYDPTLDPDFNTLASAKTAGMRFYGAGADQVECGSCHDPHDETNRPFLRLDNTGSALCNTCHIK